MDRQVPRVVMHLDMDAFYASVEVREQPELRGKPVIVGYPGPRGVVSTCSYEAREFGVRSAMPSVTAKRLCPEAIWLPGHMSLYSSVSKNIRALMQEVSPLVEPLSIDEAFIDLTGIAKDLDEGRQIGLALKQRILEQERLSASIGLAPNKFLAKVASDLDKPAGCVLLPLSAIPTILWPLPVRRLWGVGPKSAERLELAGLKTIEDVAKCEPKRLERAVGANSAEHLKRLANGEDERRVKSGRHAKSISEERTYGVDLIDPDVIDRALLARAEGVSRDLRRKGLEARTVHLKVRTPDFTTYTRSETLQEATDLAEPILATARLLLSDRVPLGRRAIRLLGLGVSGLQSRGQGQRGLFPDQEELRASRWAKVSDAVRDRIGESALTRARLLKSKESDGDDEAEEASSLPSVD